MSESREHHVRELATREGCDTSKAGVLDVLLETGSFDVQACPGSGKTTAVATKIVVLLDDWRASGGICVLTHTNVAREEIERRLAASQVGSVALRSPHFVGTIQSFIQTFVALPYLRAKGITVEQIDTAAFASAADREYSGKYFSLRGWLKKQTRAGQPEKRSYRDLEYDATSDKLTFDGKSIGLQDPSKPAYKDLQQLKDVLAERGIFRHGDMFHYADRYLKEYPWITSVLRRRFPVVIIDEMQDTSARQEALLERLFPPNLVAVQRFGDENQKIYDADSGEEDTNSFPREPVRNIGHSRRFGGFIASKIATIAPRKQTILGDETVVSGRHTIFLFDESTIFDVIPAFAQLAQAELRDVHDPCIKAVGHRKRPSADGGKFPNSIGSYVYGFVPDPVTAITGTDGLRLRVERAKLAAARSDHRDAANQVLIAIRMILARWGIAERPHQVLAKIMQNIRSRRNFGAAVLALLKRDVSDEPAWIVLLHPLFAELISAAGCPAPSAATSFAKWTEVDVAGSATSPNAKGDTLLPRIDVQTIHSVKGENHDATLVLETQFNKHDVSLILKYLTDEATRKAPLSKKAVMHHRRMFVAMSRPRRLLCLAAATARVTDQMRTEFVEQGWHLIDLSLERQQPS